MKGYIVIAVFSSQLIAGLIFADLQSIGDESFASERCRKQAGMAQTLGLLASTVWPVSVPAVYFASGFGEHGWTLERSRS